MSVSLHTKEAADTWKQLKSNWLITLTNRIVAVVTVLAFALFLIRYHTLPPQVPIWYSQPWGADQLAHPLWLLILPLGSAILYIVNTTIAIYVLSEYLIFVQVTFLTSMVVSLLSFVSLVKILFLVT